MTEKKSDKKGTSAGKAKASARKRKKTAPKKKSATMKKPAGEKKAAPKKEKSTVISEAHVRTVASESATPEESNLLARAEEAFDEKQSPQPVATEPSPVRPAPAMDNDEIEKMLNRVRAVKGAEQADTGTKDYLIFNAALKSYALAVSDVAEILRHQRITMVPRAADYVLGLTSIRGAMMPVINLGKLLSGKESLPPARGRILVLKERSLTVGLLVDDDIEIKGVSEDLISDPPAHMGREGNDFIGGVMDLEGDFVSILNKSAITRARAIGRLDEE